MVKVLLTKLESNHDRVRTKTVMGFARELPVVGEPFTMFSDPLDPSANIRMVSTTPVLRTLDPCNAPSEFWTVNSHYQIDVLGYEAEV